MEQEAQRTQIFISHATPQDNEYAIWLASRLSMAGYDVWCDQNKLLGGEDFWKDIERAIRRQAVKVVVVVSEKALDGDIGLKDGIAKELALAAIVKRELGDDDFVIPIRLDDTSFSSFPVDIVRLNAIDSSQNWADGLAKLIKALRKSSVPVSDHVATEGLDEWRTAHQFLGRSISDDNETLVTNRLAIQEYPKNIYLYKFKVRRSTSEVRSFASDCSVPCFEHAGLLGCFLPAKEFQEALTEAHPVQCVEAVSTRDFLDAGWEMIFKINRSDARRKLSSLVRQSWNLKMQDMGLKPYYMSGGHIAWWFPKGLVKDDRLIFEDFNGKQRYRVTHGTKGKRRDPNDEDQFITRFYWNLGFSAKPIVSDKRIAILPRVIVSEDGTNPIENKKRQNAARKNICATWFNDKWRCLLMGYLSWLSEGSETIELPVGGDQHIVLSCDPMSYTLPVSVNADPVSEMLDNDEAERLERLEILSKVDDPALRSTDFEVEDQDG